MPNNISLNRLNELLEQNSLSSQNIREISSFVTTSLVDYCNDFSYDEVGRVRDLQEKNLFAYFNAAAIVIGAHGQAAWNRAISLSHIASLCDVLKEEYSGREYEMMRIMIITTAILSNSTKLNEMVRPKFKGSMPSKFMAFRDTNAQEWFEKIVKTRLSILVKVYNKGSMEDAKQYLFFSVAHQLHHDNPSRYPYDNSKTESAALMDILTSFINRYQ